MFRITDAHETSALEMRMDGKLLLVEPNVEAFEHQDIVARVTAKTGTIPHTTLRYRFMALNMMAECMCEE